MRHFHAIMFVFTASIAVVACVPSITKMYNGPEVTGTVVRLFDFSPVEGALIAYYSNKAHAPISSTYSDASGQFTLTPVARRQIEIRMPAHAYRRTTIYTEHSDYANSVDIVISVHMNTEYEYYAVGNIIVDDSPEIMAPPLRKNAIDIQRLQQASPPYQFISHCEDALVEGAINKLNITRKLGHRLTQPNNPLHSRIKMQFEKLTQQTIDVWQYLANTCDAGEEHEMAGLKYQVLRELEPL